MVKEFQIFSSELLSIFMNNQFKEASLNEAYFEFQQPFLGKTDVYMTISHLIIKLVSATFRWITFSTQINTPTFFVLDCLIIIAIIVSFLISKFGVSVKSLKFSKMFEFWIIYLDFYVELLFIYSYDPKATNDPQNVSIKIKFVRTVFAKTIQLIAILLLNVNLSLFSTLLTVTTWTGILYYVGDIIGFSPPFGAATELAAIFIVPLMLFMIKQKLNYKTKKHFVQIINLKAMLKYYRGLLRNLKYPIMSFRNRNPFFINKYFIRNFEDQFVDCKLKDFYRRSERMKKSDLLQIKDSLIKLLNKYYSLKSSKLSSTFIQLLNAKFNDKVDIYYNMGIYSTKSDNSNEKISYFDVSLRIFKMHSTNILDVIISNITEIIHQKNKETEIQLKEVILSKIAHEFKTPLITITAELDSLREFIPSFLSKANNLQESNALFINKVTKIQHVSHYTIFLINDIIYYTNQNSIPLNFTSITDINTDILLFCNDVMNALVSYSTGNKSLIHTELSMLTETRDYEMVTDPIRLKQIILNFISNSVKFTKKGSISLRCYIKEVLDVSTKSFEVVFEIEDTGLGMKIEDIEKLKKGTFTLINCSSYNNSMGTGLGLGIATKICNQLGGRIEVLSELNKGSKFCVSFPILINESENSLTKTLSASARGNLMINFKVDETCNAKRISIYDNFEIEQSSVESRVVIICDDSTIILNSIKKMLNQIFQTFLPQYESQGYQIICLSDGIHLASYVIDCMVKNIQICLVLCDENMEYMNGSTAAALLKSLFERGRLGFEVPLYSITAFIDNSNLETIIKSGFIDIIGKPVTKEALISLVRKHIPIDDNYIDI